jgi:protoporphyrinogen oxidase
VRIAVVGAGITGLVAARRLGLFGHTCDVYERWPGLGGQVATLDVGAADPLERYYHHLFTSDVEIARLYDELGMGDAIQWLPSSVAVFTVGALHPFTTPADLLRFRPLPPSTRVRVGLATVALQLRRSPEPFERCTAKEWITRHMGEVAWRRLWGPLLRGKFGPRAEDITMAWLWRKMTVRRQVRGAEVRGERLGYPQGGWQPLLDRLHREIETQGGTVLIDRPVASLGANADGGLVVQPAAPQSFRRGHDPRSFEPAEEPLRYDAVLATVPSDIFLQLLAEPLREGLGGEYRDRVASAEYHAACCLLLELDRPFSPFYWTNVADEALPFVGLIEQTNLVSPDVYGGRRFLYVANYVERGDPLLELGPDELLARYLPGMRSVNAAFELDWVRERWLFHEPAAQPIVTVGYRDRIPPIRTPVPNLYLANTTQIYPEDRGTNYSVRLGEEAARIVNGERSSAGS